jgi:bisanhydrobacterioruberin hydratase
MNGPSRYIQKRGRDVRTNSRATASHVGRVTGVDAALLRLRWPLTGLLVIAGWGLANAPLRPEVWWVSALAILAFSTPVIVGAISWLGRRRGLALLAGLGAYALIFESFAVATGVPYGRFSYSDVLGPPLFGLAPPTVLLAWTPLILGCLAVTRKVWSAVALLVIVDLVLDPAAVSLGFWSWDEPGLYYGVPLINFLGWVVSGCIAVLALRRLPRPVSPVFARNLWLVLVFWTAVNAWSGQWVPVLVGLAVLAALSPHYGRTQ